MKIVVYSLGCKVNQYEGQSIITRLTELGHTAVDTLEKADAYIINTCSVTAEADKKSRQMISKVLKLNSEARIYVCGCSSQNDKEQYESRKNVKIISGASGKMQLVDSIMSDIALKLEENSLEKPQDEILPLPATYEDNLFPALTRTRGLIKIQDGCNNFCSYCIVPYLRGRSRSRSIESIVNEARLVSEESREIVLTGINISAYGKDIGTDLTELVRALKDIPSRKRFGSLECSIITKSLLSAMSESGFCDHFHLSLQSASNNVLKKMNRHYTIEEFIEKVDLIRVHNPNSGIMTDIIAGFCEETEDDHKETLSNLTRIAFSDMHVFPYSERAGTKALNLKPVDKSIRLRRASEISQLKDSLKTSFLASQVGKEQEVIIEEKEGDYFVGHTSNFIKVYTLNEGSKVLLTEIFSDGVKGEVL